MTGTGYHISTILARQRFLIRWEFGFEQSNKQETRYKQISMGKLQSPNAWAPHLDSLGIVI